MTVFDVYEGKGIEPGKKSIAIAVTLQPRDKTMTDEEIDAVAAKIVAEVSQRTGGVLRSSPHPEERHSASKTRVNALMARLEGRGRLLNSWPSFEARFARASG